jgi:hypothetical protein
MGNNTDLKALLQRAIELVMPNLRGYYRVPRKGRVVKSYASDGSYWADVQPLRNDDSDDANEPMITRIEIPVLWGGPERGVVCPPTVGTLCDITYYDGDPDYPRISNFRWERNQAPLCDLGAFVIQQKPGVYVQITATGNIVHKTDADLVNEIEGNKSETVGTDWGIEVGGSLSIKAASGTTEMSTWNIKANLVLDGELLATKGITSLQQIKDLGGAQGSLSDLRTAYQEHTHTEHGDGGGITGPPL